MISSSEIFKESVKNNFTFLKEASNIRDAYLRSIEIPNFGFLVPACYAFLDDQNLLNLLTKWRNMNVDAYPTQFQATLTSTRLWFENRVLEDENRMLFIIVTNSGRFVGHIGFNQCINENSNFEVDNVARGDKNAPKGIMTAAMNVLINWAERTIPINSFSLKVISYNNHAIDFYRKNGFINKRLIPLKKIKENKMISFVETNDANSDYYFIEMLYSPRISSGESLILTAGPSISPKESAYAYDAATHGWNSNWNKYHSKFETTFTKYIGAKYAIATSSCTGALQIALMALDIGPGDEVIVPDQTWVASAAVVTYVGANPIFADVELDSWNIDAESIEKLISPKTKAIIVVHMYGGPARMTSIMRLAKKYRLKVVEDAAPAIGAEWNGMRCGAIGDFGAFSFQGAKLLVTGEGGMLVTNNRELFEKAKKISDQGRNPLKTFWIDRLGLKFKMSNIQAAIGLGQVERANELIEMKRRIFSWYEGRLGNFSKIHLNKEITGAYSIYWMTSIRIDESLNVSRDNLIKALKERNIDTRPVFPAISQYPIWPTSQKPQPIANKVGRTALNLPSGVCLKKTDVMYICDQIIDILNLK